MAKIILLEEGVKPPTPAVGEWTVYCKGGGLYILDDAGTETGPISAGGALTDGDKGDITVSALGATWTIDNNAVSLAKLATQAANTILAEITGLPNVPTAVAIAANKFLARASTGNIAAKDVTDFAFTILDDLNAGEVITTIGAVPNTLYDANTILAATINDTPAALIVGEQTVVGRATGGNIAALAIDNDLSAVSATDDTIPSAKATKAMGDLKLPLAGGTMTGNLTFTDNTLDIGASGATRPRTGYFGTGVQIGEVAVPTISSTNTLTNKRITKRVVTTTDDATAVIDVDVTDVYELSAVANATTFSTTGAPTDGQQMIIRFKDAGVAKALTWDAIFVVIGATLPTTTVAGKWHYVGATYNTAAIKWHVIAVGVQA